MMRGVRLRKLAAAAMAAFAVHLSPAHACGYDAAMVDFAPAHPRSIEVALAVRDALDRKELHALAPVAPVLGFLRARRMLQEFQPLVSWIVGTPDASVAVLLIESGLWTRYSPTAQGVVTEVHVAGPEEGERVIVTSETVLRALLDGKFGSARATELGVLIVVRQVLVVS